MNTLKNSVHLIGHLGQDPEIVNLDTGKKIAKFSLATSDSYKNVKGEKVEDTQWHNIVAWGKTADLVENYLLKGKQVAIEGKLTHRRYENKEGEKRYFAISTGVCKVLKEKISVLAVTAESPDKIDLQRAEKAKKAAERSSTIV